MFASPMQLLETFSFLLAGKSQVRHLFGVSPTLLLSIPASLELADASQF